MEVDWFIHILVVVEAMQSVTVSSESHTDTPYTDTPYTDTHQPQTIKGDNTVETLSLL